ncbi:60S ribosomal protein-like protein L34 [Calycina marina]|uniref:Large ribosomal subunit protein bL34m n=1 Tax=Calycina marina TaxID=1763456 RepID=A0A9P8CFA3_9HELO|nr:60S ribosomal protein-like protein L34 [Calycina marina]
MPCFRYCRGFSALLIPSPAARAISNPAAQVSNRTFTTITPLRPAIFASAFKPTLPTATISGSSGEVLDLVPKISTHPALGTLQIRCGPRRTFDPSHFVRKRRHGFLSRIRTRKGRNTLQRRKSKGRSTLSH